ncbi:MAG: hypothetical protein GWM98_04870 [Nitrospinaceae bacterium]|nr:hypothetical protein [Deltaproteobacteria bacterium]NIY14253.1 hypothetical protein [Nitrospinaceae bacterium]
MIDIKWCEKNCPDFQQEHILWDAKCRRNHDLKVEEGEVCLPWVRDILSELCKLGSDKNHLLDLLKAKSYDEAYQRGWNDGSETTKKIFISSLREAQENGGKE